MKYAGLDVGTTRSKISVFDDKRYIYNDSISYPSSHTHSEHTIDANVIYKCVLELINSTLEKYPDIQAIGITSFGETFVLLDKEDTVLMESLLYTDTRGQEEAADIQTTIGKDRLGEITGQIGRSMYSLPKILNIRKNNPKLFERVSKILLIEDFIVYMLSKVRMIDYSLASRTIAFDVTKKEFSEEILNTYNLKKELFSTPCKSGTIAGTYSYKNSVVKIIPIAHDQIANAVGAGVLKDGDAVDGNGTCECVCVVSKENQNATVLYEKGFGKIPYVLDDLYASYTLINTCGSLIEWMIQSFFAKEKDENEDVFSYINKKIDASISNIYVLPYFAGAATPYMDVNATGAIVNLTLGTTKFDIYKGCLESLCYEMYFSLNELKNAGMKINRIVATGGCSKNDYFLQLKADVFNKKIYRLNGNDSGTIGSAIIVGTALGLFSNIEDGIKKMVKYDKVFIPNKENHKIHMQRYKQYKTLYKKLKGIK